MTRHTMPLILLAAGASRRMGGRDKLLEEVDGKPLLRLQAERARAFTDGPVIVALPPKPHARYAVLDGLDVIPLPVPEAAEGMNASLRTAFAALPKGTVEMLLMPENKDKLTAVLTYHVVPGKVMSGDLTNGMMAGTVEGSDVKIMTEGGVTVDGATVVAADVEASNGVIHVIDRVLLPKQ